MNEDKFPSRDMTTALVAREVRAELGRQDLTRAELARRMGVSAMWVSDRLNAKVAINLYELALFANALDIHITDLMPEGILYGGPEPRWRELRRVWREDPDRRVTARYRDTRVVAAAGRAASDMRPVGAVAATRPLARCRTS